MISYIKQNGDIRLYFDKPYFYVGEYIKGNIELTLSQTTIISGILIEISVSEHWNVKNGYEDLQMMSNNKTVVNYNIDLKKLNKYKNIDNDILFPNGISFIPFNFRFSDEYTPSFEYPLPNKRAYIRYIFLVKINSSYISSNNLSYFLCLISRPIIEPGKLLSKSINQHIKKWKIFDKGDTILKVSIPDNNYKYNSNCIVSIYIDNTNGKASTKDYKVMLIRKIKFKNKNGVIQYNDETNIVSEKIKAVVEPGKTNCFEYNLTFKEKNTEKKYSYLNEVNPYNTKMDKIDFFMPTINGGIIECNYELKISLYFKCFVAYKDRPRIIMPIYIVHQLPLDYQLEIQEQIDYQNALEKSLYNVSKNNNSNNNINNNISNISNNKKNNDEYKNDNFEVNEEEDNSLPSLEAIQDAKEFKINENKINENNNNIFVDDINKSDNCPPCVFDSAPIPLPINDKSIRNLNNNSYPLYNERNNNNYPEYNEYNYNNLNINIKSTQNNVINERPEDFSIFNTDNISLSSKKSLKRNYQQNNYININEI